MDREKYVDESWKESVEVEKQTFSSKGQEPHSSLEKPTPESKQPPMPEPEQDHSEEIPAAHEVQPDPNDPGAIQFLNYITSLGFQAMIFLGEIPHPMTNEVEKNLEQAKFIIDTLAMLREKTQNNLSKQESDVLNSSIYELQLKFVEVSEKDKAGA